MTISAKEADRLIDRQTRSKMKTLAIALQEKEAECDALREELKDKEKINQRLLRNFAKLREEAEGEHTA